MVPVSFVDCMNLVPWHFLPKNFRSHQRYAQTGSFILVKGLNDDKSDVKINTTLNTDDNR